MARAAVPEFIFQRLPAKMPPGWTLAPIFPGEERSPVRACVVLQEAAGPPIRGVRAGGWRPIASPFIVRDLPDATVLLGCVADQLGQISQWLEIWVQQPLDESAKVERIFQEGLHNTLMDSRWRQRAEALRASGEAQVFWTGYEDRPLPPIYLVRDERGGWRAVHPADSSGARWTLCTDDRRLAEAGLPEYSTSLFRALAGAPGQGGRFLNVGGQAESDSGKPARSDAPTPELLNVPAESVALHPAGGRIMLLRHEPLSFEQFLDALSGEVPEDGAVRTLISSRVQETGAGEAATVDGWLVAGLAGRWARLAETLYLKLRILADAVASVRDSTARLRCPLLSLSPESFRVRLMPPGPDLPTLWSAETVLIESGEAIEVKVGTTNTTYFVPMRRRELGNYQPIAAQRRRAGDTRIRVIVVSDPDPETGAQTVEISVDVEDLELKRNDLFHFKCTIGDVRRDLSAFIENVPDSSETHARISTIPQVFNPPLDHTCEGGQHLVSYRVVPLVSTPFDLHALAVLAVRTLLVPTGGQRALVDAVDRLEQLAKQAAKIGRTGAGESQPSDPKDAATAGSAALLTERIKEVLRTKADLREALGPHKLVGPSFGAISFEEAVRIVPLDLWCSILAAIVRMFPGLGPDSTCQDVGQADRTGVHRVFDQAKSDLSDLLVRSRALLVSDQSANREIVDAIKVQLAQLETGKF